MSGRPSALRTKRSSSCSTFGGQARARRGHRRVRRVMSSSPLSLTAVKLLARRRTAETAQSPSRTGDEGAPRSPPITTGDGKTVEGIYTVKGVWGGGDNYIVNIAEGPVKRKTNNSGRC